jgi:hypothetical protein
MFLVSALTDVLFCDVLVNYSAAFRRQVSLF